MSCCYCRQHQHDAPQACTAKCLSALNVPGCYPAGLYYCIRYAAYRVQHTRTFSAETAAVWKGRCMFPEQHVLSTLLNKQALPLLQTLCLCQTWPQGIQIGVREIIHGRLIRYCTARGGEFECLFTETGGMHVQLTWEVPPITFSTTLPTLSANSCLYLQPSVTHSEGSRTPLQQCCTVAHCRSYQLSALTERSKHSHVGQLRLALHVLRGIPLPRMSFRLLGK